VFWYEEVDFAGDYRCGEGRKIFVKEEKEFGIIDRMDVM